MFCDGLYEYIGCDIEGFKHTLLCKLSYYTSHAVTSL